MKEPRIQCVCGFGCGSSLMLRMAVDDILKAEGLSAQTFTGDVGTCLSNPCDVIFISRELGDRIEGRAEVPVVIIDNFMDNDEVREKILSYIESVQ